MTLDRSTVRRVLCAIDAARPGSASLHLASLLAERFHASVDALYAMPPTPPFDGRVARVRRLIGEHNAQERLQSIIASAQRQVCISSFTTRGTASSVILSHSQQHASDLIVMSSARRQRYGSPASTIAPVSAQAPCAVLTVGEEAVPRPVRRILLPVAVRGVQRTALSWAATLAAQFDAEVGLLSIGAFDSGLWRLFSASQAEPAHSNVGSKVGLSEALAVLWQMQIAATEVASPGGDDDDALSNLCDSGAFDLVVLGLPAPGNGRNRSDALVANVRRRTCVPVLSVRALRSPASFALRFSPPRISAASADRALTSVCAA